MKKFDFHIHSTCSKHKIWGIDGLNTPREIVETAVRIGLDGIAITDHNSIKGGQKAIKYVKENNIDLLIIPGAEIRSNLGDILALGINENISQGLSILETADAIQDQGGIAIVAHPYKCNSKLGSKLKKSPVHMKFTAIEVFNANIRKEANYKALNLAKTLDMPGIAGSDAHSIHAIGNAITCLEIENLSVDKVLNAIKKNEIELICNYTPFRDILNLYFKKLGHFFKRCIGKGNNSCEN